MITSKHMIIVRGPGLRDMLENKARHVSQCLELAILLEARAGTQKVKQSFESRDDRRHYSSCFSCERSKRIQASKDIHLRTPL